MERGKRATNVLQTTKTINAFAQSSLNASSRNVKVRKIRFLRAEVCYDGRTFQNLQTMNV